MLASKGLCDDGHGPVVLLCPSILEVRSIRGERMTGDSESVETGVRGLAFIMAMTVVWTSRVMRDFSSRSMQSRMQQNIQTIRSHRPPIWEEWGGLNTEGLNLCASRYYWWSREWDPSILLQELRILEPACLRSLEPACLRILERACLRSLESAHLRILEPACLESVGLRSMERAGPHSLEHAGLRSLLLLASGAWSLLPLLTCVAWSLRLLATVAWSLLLLAIVAWSLLLLAILAWCLVLASVALSLLHLILLGLFGLISNLPKNIVRLLQPIVIFSQSFPVGC